MERLPFFAALLMAGFCKADEKFNYTAAENERLLDSYQYIECFDHFNGQGGSVKLTYGNENLFSIGWDNAFSSCCFNGFWFLYEDPEFNRFNENRMVYYGFGEDHCRNLNDGSPSFANKASSLRYIGAYNNYKYDSITIFGNRNFGGAAQNAFSEKNLDIQYYGRSVAITGCNPWTVYTNTNFNGNCACLYPKSMIECEAGLFPDLQYFNDNIASVRRGCFCSYHKYPPY